MDSSDKNNGKSYSIDESNSIDENNNTPPVPAYQGDKPYIFISYAHKDSKLVYPELERFYGEGYKIWYDEGISSGERWQVVIERALEKSKLVVLFLSANAVNSRNVRNETFLALDENIPIIPIYLEDTELKHGLKLQLNSLPSIEKYKITEEKYIIDYHNEFKKYGFELNKQDSEESNIVERIDKPPIPAYQGDEPYIFISYAHVDSELVYPELERFYDEGYKIWYDEGITSGKRWQEVVETALVKSTLVVWFVSTNSIESENVRNEIFTAIDERLDIIPIYLEKTKLGYGLKVELRSIQSILKYQMSEAGYIKRYRKEFKKYGFEIKEQKTSPKPETRWNKTKQEVEQLIRITGYKSTELTEKNNEFFNEMKKYAKEAINTQNEQYLLTVMNKLRLIYATVYIDEYLELIENTNIEFWPNPIIRLQLGKYQYLENQIIQVTFSKLEETNNFKNQEVADKLIQQGHDNLKKNDFKQLEQTVVKLYNEIEKEPTDTRIEKIEQPHQDNISIETTAEEVSEEIKSNFTYLDKLIHKQKEIKLKEDITLDENEIKKYTDGIPINVDDITIDGNGHTIDAQEKTRIFTTTGKNITLQNITLQNAYTTKNGAAIHNDRGKITLKNSTLQNNKSKTSGGAINNQRNGTITIQNTQLIKNEAKKDGGAINNKKATINIKETTLTRNTAQNKGGAINNENTGQITLTDTTFKENTAQKEDRSIHTANKENIKITNCKFDDAQPEPSLIQADITNNTVDNLTLDITVSNAKTGEAISEGLVDVYLNKDIIGTGELENGKATVITNISEIGTYDLHIEYSGNEYYMPSKTTLENIKAIGKEATIKAQQKNTKIGNTTLEINLTDKKTKNPIQNEEINIKLPQNKNIKTKTDKNGNITTPIDLPVGKHDITITHPSNKKYNTTETTLTINIKAHKTQTHAKITENTVNNVTLDINVTDEAGQNITNGKITIYANDTLIATKNIKNEKTTIKTNIDKKGFYDINVVYEGTEKYEKSNITLEKVEVIGLPSKIKVETTNTLIDNTTININLSQANTNKAIQYAEITLILPNKKQIKAKTNIRGNLKIPLDLPIGLNQVKITYQGNQVYNATETTHKINVEAYKTNIAAEVINDIADDVTIDVNVTDTIQKNPVTAGSVIAKVKDIIVGRSEIENGKAQIQTNIKKEGTYDIIIKYQGNQKYENNEITLKNIKIKAKTSSKNKKNSYAEKIRQERLAKKETNNDNATNNNNKSEKTSSYTFKYLNDLIISGRQVISLRYNLEYNPITDDRITPLKIDNPLTIIGNGHTLDAKGKTSIFNSLNKEFKLKNIILKNSYGSVISGPCEITNTTFIGNTAPNGQKIIDAPEEDIKIENCTFKDNKPEYIQNNDKTTPKTKPSSKNKNKKSTTKYKKDKKTNPQNNLKYKNQKKTQESDNQQTLKFNLIYDSVSEKHEKFKKLELKNPSDISKIESFLNEIEDDLNLLKNNYPDNVQYQILSDNIALDVKQNYVFIVNDADSYDYFNFHRIIQTFSKLKTMAYTPKVKNEIEENINQLENIIEQQKKKETTSKTKTTTKSNEKASTNKYTSKYLEEFEKLNKTTTSIYDLGKYEVLIILEDGTNLTNWNDVKDKEQVLYISEDLSKYTILREKYKGFESLKAIVPLELTNNVISTARMFDSCHSLRDINALKNWNTINVRNMNEMFSGCFSLTDISPLKELNTTNVTNMNKMFSFCSDLTDISPLKEWNTNNVTNMGAMFDNCSSLTDINALKEWNTTNVTNMSWMFSSCSSLTDINALKNWNTTNVTDMSWMFSFCSSLTDISPLKELNTTNVTNMDSMFEGCLSLKGNYPEWYEYD